MTFVLLGILNAQAEEAVVASDFDLLETQTLAGTAASVTFTGLDTYTDYKHLQFRIVTRSVRSGVSNDQMLVTLNSDTGSNYAWHQLEGTGSSLVTTAGSSQTSMRSGLNAVSTESAGIFGATVLDILDFSDTAKNTTLRSLTGVSGSFTSVRLQSGLFNDTSAITSINFDQFGTEFVAGSRFSLYGIKAGA